MHNFSAQPSQFTEIKVMPLNTWISTGKTRTDLPSLNKINSSQILAQWSKQRCAVSFLKANIQEISIPILAVTISSARSPQQPTCFRWLKQTKDSAWTSYSPAALDIATNTAPPLDVVPSKRMKNPLSKTQKREVLEYSFIKKKKTTWIKLLDNEIKRWWSNPADWRVP